MPETYDMLCNICRSPHPTGTCQELSRATWDLTPEFLHFFEMAEDGKMVNKLYSKPSECPGPIEATIPRMIVGFSEDDIKEEPTAVRYGYMDFQDPIYDERGLDVDYQRIQVMGGLKEYVRFHPLDKPPLYVSDNHNHALFAWQEAREAGAVKDGAILVRFDDHLDMSRIMPRDLGSLSRNKIRESISNDRLTGIDIENFTEFAFQDGLLSKMMFINGMVGTSEEFGAINEQVSEHVNNGSFQFVSPMLLDQGVDALVDLVVQQKKIGRSIILDIDFDVFRKDLLQEHAEILEQAIRRLVSVADLITCATSPGYGNHTDNVKRVKAFVKRYLMEPI